jgi:hypothetical protein
VFENSVLERFFVYKWEILEIWRKLKNEELHNSYSSSNIITAAHKSE